MSVNGASAYGLRALMYMVRHLTQLPATPDAIAKTEDMPVDELAEVLQQLTQAGLVRPVQDCEDGYVFARAPEEIALLDVFETLEGRPLLEDCPLRPHECGGAPEDCCILAGGEAVAGKGRELFAKTNIVTAAWNHLGHRFAVPSRTAQDARLRIETITLRSQMRREEPCIPSDLVPPSNGPMAE